MKLFRTDYPLTPSFDLVGKSFALLRQNIWPAFYLIFLPGLIVGVGSTLMRHIVQPNSTIIWDQQASVGLVVILVGAILSLLTTPAALVMQLQAIRGKSPEALDCFKIGIKRLLPLIVMIIIMEFAIIGGFVLFIVPGLFLLRSFFLAQYYVVDQKLGPIQALKKSRADSLPNAGYIWGVIGLLIGFSMASSFVSSIPAIGYILGLAVGLIFIFVPALRYEEIRTLKTTEPRKPTT